MPSLINVLHHDTSDFLKAILGGYARLNDLGKVLGPFQMKLPGKDGPGREPDVVFVAKANLGKLQHTFIDGAGDLAIEVISPESVERDRVDKFAEYAAGGVAEYWLIDPQTQEAEFYLLNEKNQYEAVSPDEQGKYYSRSMSGLWIKPIWLWRKPLPDANDVLKLVAGSAYENYLARSPQPDL